MGGSSKPKETTAARTGRILQGQESNKQISAMVAAKQWLLKRRQASSVFGGSETGMTTLGVG